MLESLGVNLDEVRHEVIRFTAGEWRPRVKQCVDGPPLAVLQLDPSLAVEGCVPTNSHESKKPDKCNRGAANPDKYEYIVDQCRHCLATILAPEGRTLPFKLMHCLDRGMPRFYWVVSQSQIVPTKAVWPPFGPLRR